MNKFTADNIDTTLSTIESLILNCEKIQPKLQEGSSQQSLIKNRIKALCIAKSLITGKKHDFTAEEILQMHKTMSLSKLAEYLHCSISTVQNKIREARAEMRNL